MIVSWNWLKEYVDLPMSADELNDRLTISGLNLEGVEKVAGDLAIDLEVTSNRPDCLGHIGVAREVSVLFGSKLSIPEINLQENGPAVETLTSVEIECPQLCPYYSARVIQGVKIGPSPAWLQERLRTLGIAVINNVVDVSNYVMMECAQPLHVFDFAKLTGQRIIVRESKPKEEFLAIDHKTYALEAGTCVIADAKNSVALAGVMGGADSEVSETTVDLLIESADFDPLSVRSTARRHSLHSPSSYRFERGVDPIGIDWASRRCCQLILETAGGTLAKGVVTVGELKTKREPVTLRFSQLKRILGIDIPVKNAKKILADLGLKETAADEEQVTVVPPTWRADLTREIDLVEEVARIHGYDAIPEDVGVPLAASSRSTQDLVFEKVQQTLVAAGFHEAFTISAVEENWLGVFSPWCDKEALQVTTPVLRRADRLRQSVVPSLLNSRRTNETLSNAYIELFEIAKIYLPNATDLPDERWMLSLTSGQDFRGLKGVIEALVQSIAPGAALSVKSYDDSFFIAGRGVELLLDGKRLGFLGEVSENGRKPFGLRGETTVAEIDLGVLVAQAKLIRIVQSISPYPPVSRDLNIVVDEKVRWADVENIVQQEANELLEQLSFQEEYRDAKRLGKNKKSLLFSFRLRSKEGTLTNEQADALRDSIVGKLGKTLGGKIRN